jgi:diguanylate cyclase (GGDEF)-like protein
MSATRDARFSPARHSHVPTWDLLIKRIDAPRSMVLATAAVASIALIGVDRVIDSDAHLLLGFFVIVVMMTWTGHTIDATITSGILLGLWSGIDAGEATTSIVLLGLLSATVLLALGILLTRTFRKLILEMDEAARRDSLTGLLNTGAFQEIAERERARALRTGKPISVAFLDLDQFKQINDAHGHVVGDAVLAAFGSVIQRSVRVTDIVARVGGDEFTLVFPETDQFETSAVLQRIRHRISMRTDIPLVTATMGFVTFTAPPDSVEEMVRMADELMYRAKHRHEDGGVLIGRVCHSSGDAGKPVMLDITAEQGAKPNSTTATPDSVSGHEVPPEIGIAQAL